MTDVEFVDASALAAILLGEPAGAALAEATGLTVYDASYLWLARKLGAPLVTLDHALQRAAAAVDR